MKPPRRVPPAGALPESHVDRPAAGRRLLRSLHLLRVLVTATLEEGGLPAGKGLSRVQMDLLRLLAAQRGAPATIGAIARKLQVSAPAASKAVGRLIAAGHVVSRPDPADARSLHIEVTAKGEAAIRRYAAARASRVETIRRQAGDAAVERWIATFEEVVGALIDAGRHDGLPCLQCGLHDPPTCAAEKRGTHCPVRLLEDGRAARTPAGID